MPATDKFASVKDRRVQINAQDWVDGEIPDNISLKENSIRKNRKSKFHIDKTNVHRFKV